MDSRDCMIDLMADVIGLDDKYTGGKLNDGVIWDDFIRDIFHRVDTIEDNQIRGVLDSIDKETFQYWIDDPKFWADVDNEIVRRSQLLKTVIPSNNQGYC